MNDHLTVTDVIENAFCPKFTYYGLVLGLRQYEEKRGTVKTGRKHHHRHATTNTEYNYEKINGQKHIETAMYSKTLQLAGKIDEAIETENEIILIERKYTNYTQVTALQKIQIGLLSILAEEHFGKPVKKTILFLTGEKRIKIEVTITEEIRETARQQLLKTTKIIQTGTNPFSEYDGRCANCCYRKVCPVGTLKTSQ